MEQMELKLNSKERFTRNKTAICKLMQSLRSCTTHQTN